MVKLCMADGEGGSVSFPEPSYRYSSRLMAQTFDENLILK